MAKALYGLKAIKMGDVVNETTMPADNALTEFKTYRDSFELNEEEGQITEEFSDQSDEPIVVFQEKGSRTIKANTYDYSPEFLKDVKGGTIVSGEWKEPDTTPTVYKALKIVTDSGQEINIPKVQVFARFNLKLKKKEVALLEMTFKPLSKVSIK